MAKRPPPKTDTGGSAFKGAAKPFAKGKGRKTPRGKPKSY
jgi:hypothetical protein